MEELRTPPSPQAGCAQERSGGPFPGAGRSFLGLQAQRRGLKGLAGGQVSRTPGVTACGGNDSLLLLCPMRSPLCPRPHPPGPHSLKILVAGNHPGNNHHWVGVVYQGLVDSPDKDLSQASMGSEPRLWSHLCQLKVIAVEDTQVLDRDLVGHWLLFLFIVHHLEDHIDCLSLRQLFPFPEPQHSHLSNGAVSSSWEV